MARKTVATKLKEQSEVVEAQAEGIDDSTVMQGGPGADQEVIDDAGDKVKASDLVEVVIDGQKYKVAGDTAAILQAQQRQFDRTLSEVKKTVMPQDEKKQKVEETDDDVTVKFFANPKKFLDDFKTEILSTTRQSLTAEYTQDQSQKQFWTDFYSEHKDLDPKKDHILVETILRRDSKKLYDMQVGDASKELADLTRKEILALVGRHKGEKAGNRTTTLESGSGTTNRGQKTKVDANDEDEPKRSTLSSLIKDRKAKRRALSA